MPAVLSGLKSVLRWSTRGRPHAPPQAVSCCTHLLASGQLTLESGPRYHSNRVDLSIIELQPVDLKRTFSGLEGGSRRVSWSPAVEWSGLAGTTIADCSSFSGLATDATSDLPARSRTCRLLSRVTVPNLDKKLRPSKRSPVSGPTLVTTSLAT